MAEETMPAAETNDVVSDANHYEFAFHVLPTVAEGEVAGVFDTLKAHITKLGGVMTTEEAPQRVDLAYEIVKPIEGKNRRFRSSYFGWVRFTLTPEQAAVLGEELDAMPEILRSLMIKLTRIEEAAPFYYHEAMAAQKQVVNVDESDTEDSSDDDTSDDTDAGDDTTEDEGEVSDEELEDSLEKITK